LRDALCLQSFDLVAVVTQGSEDSSAVLADERRRRRLRFGQISVAHRRADELERARLRVFDGFGQREMFT